uniref:Phage tail collar domain-containing protein n=1 Tax=Chromera velia CCMP2878 TaxID=1169474 RepID=A0A0G4FSR3_9ALVE|eukprot:Cvel_18565.t1-p1 / transcript=Cvel_18565.t1 / gene=Cvel_18565 / organism=Chromera_velia_CCMP2878 / gene_product=hypothetical protein / transcript_product=hypothetical protein / location=Cvel_scaffold1547:6600-9520(+) / protein_length=625 / sequence_SO=supercontig / SO=protein_coding / is_pseudo=false
MKLVSLLLAPLSLVSVAHAGCGLDIFGVCGGAKDVAGALDRLPDNIRQAAQKILDHLFEVDFPPAVDKVTAAAKEVEDRALEDYKEAINATRLQLQELAEFAVQRAEELMKDAQRSVEEVVMLVEKETTKNMQKIIADVDKRVNALLDRLEKIGQELFCAVTGYVDTFEKMFASYFESVDCECVQEMLKDNPGLKQDCKCSNCFHIGGWYPSCRCNPWSLHFGPGWYNRGKYQYLRCHIEKPIDWERWTVDQIVNQLSIVQEASLSFRCLEDLQPGSTVNKKYFSEEFVHYAEQMLVWGDNRASSDDVSSPLIIEAPSPSVSNSSLSLSSSTAYIAASLKALRSPAPSPSLPAPANEETNESALTVSFTVDTETVDTPPAFLPVKEETNTGAKKSKHAQKQKQAREGEDPSTDCKGLTVAECASKVMKALQSQKAELDAAMASFTEREKALATREEMQKAVEAVNATAIEAKEAASKTVSTGTIVAMASSEVPEGFLFCDGSTISRLDYVSLFKVVGETFGAGDGSSTFNLPDLRGRTLIGHGQGVGLTERVVGSTGGNETHKLSESEMPSHSHSVTIFQGQYPQSGKSTNCWSGTRTAESAKAGGDKPHNNMQPFAVVKYYIKA